MYLLKAEIENFLILKEAEVPLDIKELVLVLGYSLDGGRADSNGVGKSSLFEAICWCLYGKTYKGLSHDDVVSNRSTGGTRVAVDLKVGTDEITVIRHRKHKKYKDKLHVIVNGKNKTPFKQTDAEALLSSYLPLSYSAFKHVCYFGQGMKDKFLALNDTGRKELLEELLGLDVFGAAEKRVKKKVKVLRERKLYLDGRKQAYGDSCRDLKGMIEELEAKKDESLKEIKRKRKKLKLQIKELKGYRADTLAKQFKQDKKVTSLQKKRDKADKELKNLWSKKYSLDQERLRFVADRNSLKVRRNGLKDLSVCDACEQKVPKIHVKKRLRIIANEILELDEAIEETEVEVESLGFETAEEIVKAISEKFGSLDTRKLAYEVSRLDDAIDKTKFMVAELGEREAELLAPSDKLREALSETQEDLAAIVTELAEIASEEPYLAFWEKGFSASGVRSLLLDDVLTYLNSRMGHHSRAVSDGEIAIQFSPQTKLKSGDIREKMSVSASTGGAGYKAASGGQQRRMDLAVHFALSDLTSMVTGHKINLLICDEVIDCIDETGTDAILEMLGDKTRQGMTVFLIDHTDAVKDNVEHVLVVTKENGVSTSELT